MSSHPNLHIPNAHHTPPPGRPAIIRPQNTQRIRLLGMIHHPDEILTPRIAKNLDMRHRPDPFPKINLDKRERAVVFIVVGELDALLVVSDFGAVAVFDAVAEAFFVIVLADVANVEAPGCAALGQRGGGVGGWEGESAGAQDDGKNESGELHFGYGLFDR